MLKRVRVKSDLSKKEIKRIKKVATDLLARLKEEKLKADNWKAKESTRDAVRNEILDFLYDENTGLSVDFYTEDEVTQKANEIYLHIFQQYDQARGTIYQEV